MINFYHGDGNDALRRHADLTLVHEGAERGCFHRLVQVGILQDNERSFAAELEQTRLEVLRAALRDDAPDRRGAGEVDPPHRRMIDQGADDLARIRRGIGDDVDDAFGKAGIDPLKDLPGYALRRASAAVMATLAVRLAALDLRPSEASVLLVIDANPRVTQSAIGRLLDIARANMAPLTARLVARGLVVRESAGGRSHGLTLSDPGRRLTRKAQRLVAQLESELMERIPASQRIAFLRTLRALVIGW